MKITEEQVNEILQKLVEFGAMEYLGVQLKDDELQPAYRVIDKQKMLEFSDKMIINADNLK